MRMRGIVALVAAALLLAGCAPAPQPDAPLGPITIPPDLSWQYASTCLSTSDSLGPSSMSWGADQDASVQFEEDTPETQAAAAEMVECLDRYPYEPGTQDFGLVDAFERSQLYDYYTSVTLPCLQRHGIEPEPVARTTFFAPDRRPWNPYPDMQGVAFEKLYVAYRACPPVPEYLQAQPE
jgi:hypothetical protein